MSVPQFDAIIIGSGFGGSVASYRLAAAGRSVCVLERGKPYPPGSFPRRPQEMARNVWDPSEGLHGLFDIWSFRNIDAIVSSGLGGGSLIYANVLLRKDEHWFTQPTPDGGGQEDWPVTRRDLDPHYDAVERMLDAQVFPHGRPGYEQVAKTEAMRDAAARLGLQWGLPPLAVSFANAGAAPVPGEQLRPGAYPNLHGRPRLTCRLCGECDIGCNDGSKNTLDHTYLSAARAHGAEIRTHSEVRRIVPAGAGYEVGYVEHQPDAEGAAAPSRELPLHTITASRVVLAAGALGTTYLLLRNARLLPGLGSALGTRFCGNGDAIAFAVPRRGLAAPRVLNASRGPVITSYIRMPDAADGEAGRGPGFYVEDAGYPVFADWIVEAANLPGVASRAMRFAWRRLLAWFGSSPRSDIGAEIGRLIGEGRLTAASLPLLGMGRDVPDGVMRLNDTHLDVDWREDTSRFYFARLEATMRGIAEAWGTELVANPLSALRRLVTVHPLGGCPMGDGAVRGVVDAFGESFGHPGLYVMDGAVMPGPVGANPALTIAAFADRATERMLENWAAPRRQPAAHAAFDPAAPATALSFREQMRGHVAPGETEPASGARRGEEAGHALMVDLTITIADVAAFLSNPIHPGTAGGFVDSATLGGRLPVERGTFHLFRPTEELATTTMCYRLFFRDATGAKLTLVGTKIVRDDPGFDIWQDTTTLFTRIHGGHVAEGEEAGAPVVAAGIISISAVDFLRQLTTFRADGPDRAAERRALADFGMMFMRQLWTMYGGTMLPGPDATFPRSDRR